MILIFNIFLYIYIIFVYKYFRPIFFVHIYIGYIFFPFNTVLGSLACLTNACTPKCRVGK